MALAWGGRQQGRLVAGCLLRYNRAMNLPVPVFLEKEKVLSVLSGRNQDLFLLQPPGEDAGLVWFDGPRMVEWLDRVDAPFVPQGAGDARLYGFFWEGLEVLLEIDDDPERDMPGAAWVISDVHRQQPSEGYTVKWNVAQGPVDLPLFFEALSLAIFGVPLPEDCFFARPMPVSIRAFREKNALEALLPAPEDKPARPLVSRL